MVNHCDIRLLQRVQALADNMNQQFSGLPDIFDEQVKCFLAYNGLYAAHQVLLLNRKLPLSRRLRAVAELWGHPLMVQAFAQAHRSDCDKKLKWKLRFASRNQPFLLFALLQCKHIYQHMKSER